jgi:hypothetical protein
VATLDTITITKGDDAGRDITITRDGAPLDISAMTVSWEAVSAWADTAALLGPYDATITDGPNGQCRVNIPGADTVALTKSAYLWEAWVTDQLDAVVTVMRGSLFVLASGPKA